MAGGDAFLSAMGGECSSSGSCSSVCLQFFVAARNRLRGLTNGKLKPLRKSNSPGRTKDFLSWSHSSMGQPLEFIVDTGATISLIDSGIAEKLRLPATGRTTFIQNTAMVGDRNPIVKIDEFILGKALGQGVEMVAYNLGTRESNPACCRQRIGCGTSRCRHSQSGPRGHRCAGSKDACSKAQAMKVMHHFPRCRTMPLCPRSVRVGWYHHRVCR